ncbi:hypothetical protein [Methylocystis parvus]|uniref:hypothetical protein n=1 Tax=Methylocystis parvus TaxID=134 RepID=UPI003C74763D
MKRFETARATVARKFASRPVRAALAVKIAFAIMAANVSFAAAKAVFHKTDAAAPIAATTGSSVKPFIIPVEDKTEIVPEAATQTTEVASLSGCHDVVTQTDDGYGVRGTVTRTVCRKAL